MLLIFASRHDSVARALLGRWKAHDARLMTCRDLSTAGWRYYPDDPRASRAVVAGRVIPFERIEGVVTRLPSVREDELPHIALADRSYVAAEMTAFLTAWLSGAAFPVVNRPTPVCLMGPHWREEQWLQAAMRTGMRVRQTTRLLALRAQGCPPLDGNLSEAGCNNGSGANGHARADDRRTDTSPVTVTVVGGQCLGVVEATLKTQARRLADEAGVELLDVQFDDHGRDAAFVGAYLAPDVSQPRVADALLAHFHALRGVGELAGVER